MARGRSEVDVIGYNGLAPASRANPFPVVVSGNEYETVAASVTAQALGATGGIGDYIHGVLVTPSATTIGVVTLLDGAISIPLVVGGTYPLTPFFVPLGIRSVSGAWKITTGVAVTVVAVGDFKA